MWPYSEKNIDKSNFEALAHRPFPILCVMGNHDPILGIKDRQETDIGIGETVYQIQDKPFIAYLKRGKAYNIGGFKFLVLGGALSIDKKRRQPGITWWEEEYWSEEEKASLFRLIETDNAFDFVISHTGPYKINYRLFKDGNLYPQKFEDQVAFLNDEINEKIRFRKWLCAHWFQDEYFFDDKTKKAYQYLYDTTRIVERIGDRVTTYRENETAEAGGDLAISTNRS
jgi:hypothetical protein